MRGGTREASWAAAREETGGTRMNVEFNFLVFGKPGTRRSQRTAPASESRGGDNLILEGANQRSGFDSGALVIAEYTALRQEVLGSLAAQQTIMNYGLATVATVFVGNFYLLGQAAPTTDTSAITAVVLFANLLLIPGVVFSLTLAWFGELARVERAGAYIRGLEDELRARVVIGAGPSGRAALGWETHLRSRKGGLAIGKAEAGYVGTVGSLFVGMLAADGFSVFQVFVLDGGEFRAGPSTASPVLAGCR